MKMLLKKILKILLQPNTPVTNHKSNLKYLGTDYGGWYYMETDTSDKPVLVSGGAGEDISFEVEFAKKYSAKAIIIDPTPRSISHVTSVLERVSKRSEPATSYSNNGKQPVDSYDLTGIDDDQIIFEPVALWNANTRVKFFAPSNTEHVSHSIINLQNTDRSIEVNGVTLESILHKYSLSKIDILKLDIEGAEIEVLIDMLDKSILPDQILVEFDEINFPSIKSKIRVEKVYNLLISKGYDLVNINNGSDYFFILKNTHT